MGNNFVYFVIFSFHFRIDFLIALQVIIRFVPPATRWILRTTRRYYHKAKAKYLILYQSVVLILSIPTHGSHHLRVHISFLWLFVCIRPFLWLIILSRKTFNSIFCYMSISHSSPYFSCSVTSPYIHDSRQKQ